jgi:hypothetical protein
MSANNQLVIIKTEKGYILKHLDMDCGFHKDKWPEFKTLEDVVKAANKWMEENECEYGLSINL